MDNLARQTVTRILSAMTVDEFAEIASESRGLNGDQVADLLRSSDYDQINQRGAKERAVQALRNRNGKDED